MHGMGYFRSARNMIRIPCQIYDCTHGKIDFPGLQHIISNLMYILPTILAEDSRSCCLLFSTEWTYLYGVCRQMYIYPEFRSSSSACAANAVAHTKVKSAG